MTMNSRQLLKATSVSIIVMALLLAGCATPAATKAPVVAEPEDNNFDFARSEATEEAAPSLDEAPADKSGGSGGGPSFVEPAATSAAEESYDGRGDSFAPPAESEPGAVVVVPPGGSDPAVVAPDQQFQSNVTAGEIDDNKDFGAYLQYRLDYMRFLGYPVHDRDVTERHIVRVKTANGMPVLGADVRVYDGQTLVATLRTPATGMVSIFPLAYNLSGQASTLNVQASKDQSTKSFNLSRQSSDDVWEVTLDVQSARPPVQLDVLFLLDSTGSMGDEIEQLRSNILSISAQIAALPTRPDVRFGMVTYRDQGDEYVTRISDFTDSVQEFQSVLMGVQAAAGGDEPESLNEGLYRAIHDVHWRQDNTVSLIFLVADAPPHLDYFQDYDYAQEMQNAVEMGIKIHPIASSGLSDQGEYIFRQLAQYTGGHFIFLTYDSAPQSSGEPGTDLHVQEDAYSVEDLDRLVVRLIQEELAALSGQGQQ